MMNDDDNEGDDDEGDEDRPQSQGWLGWWQFWWSDKVQFIIFLCSQLLRHTWCLWGWPRWRSVCCWFLTTASSFIGGATMVVENWSVSKPFTTLVAWSNQQWLLYLYFCSICIGTFFYLYLCECTEMFWNILQPWCLSHLMYLYLYLHLYLYQSSGEIIQMWWPEATS